MTTQAQVRDAMQFINEQDVATLERFIERLEFRGKIRRSWPTARRT